MIITVFGDVHGNLIALNQLFKIEKKETDLFICHGDVVNYGPWSNECVTFLQDIKNIKLLKGNHEEYYLCGRYPGENIIAQSFFDFCYPQFSEELLLVLSDYQDQFTANNIIIKHTIGSQYIFKDTDISNLEVDSNYIIGHSHQQFERKKNHFKIYNTGSIGQNREFINQSCYIQIDTITKKVKLKSFIYDISKVINEMKSRNYPKICVDYYLSKKAVHYR